MFKVLKLMFKFFLPDNNIYIVRIEDFYCIKRRDEYLDDYRIKSSHYFDMWWKKGHIHQCRFYSLELAEKRLAEYMDKKDINADIRDETVVKSVCIT